MYIGYAEMYRSREISMLSHPFSNRLWFAIIVIILLSTVLFVTIGYKTNAFEAKPVNIGAFFRSFDIFTNQDGEGSWKSVSARLAIAATTITTLFIVPSYSGALASSILLPRFKLPFTDLEEFVKDGSYRIVYPNSLKIMFQVSDAFSLT